MTDPSAMPEIRLPTRQTHIRAIVVTLVGLAALVALASQLLGGWEKSAETLAQADRGWLATSLLFTVAYVASGGVGWWLVLGTLGQPMGVLDGVRVFFLSSLVRYLPGRIWYLVSRVYMAGEMGVPAAVTSVSLIVEIVLILASGSLVAALATPLILADCASVFTRLGLPTPQFDCGPPAIAFGGLVLLGGLIGLHPIILRPAIIVAARLLRRPLEGSPDLRYRDVLRLVAFYCVVWLFGSLALWALLESLQPIGVDKLATIAAGYAVSFLVGFVNPLMPAGLGVREGLLAVLLVWVAPLSIAAAVAVLFRVTVTLGEALIVLVCAGLQYRWLRARRQSTSESASDGGT